MKVRSGAIVGTAVGVLTPLGLLLLLGATDPEDSAGVRAGVAGFGVALLLVALRLLFVGVHVRRTDVVVRSMWWSRRLPAGDVAGLAIEPVLRRRMARLVVVTRDGEFVPSVFAAWRLKTVGLQGATLRTATAVGSVCLTDGDARDAVGVVTASGRLEHPAAFTAWLPDGRLVAVPAVTPSPGLTPGTVGAAVTPMLGRETAFVTAAFVLPAVAAAVLIFAQHVARISDLDEFELPLPNHLATSLVLMVLLYLTTAVVTPVALLLLARTGQWPRRLGLGLSALRRDVLPGVGLLLGGWVTTALIAIPLSPLLDNESLSNSQSNTHVPAYFVVFAIVVSATTAINEEVLVNGFLMTRLAQLGWRPWSSLALSLALRTSYHAYYGLGLVATIPFGYWATRSFQKHGRLGRPIIAHFLNDAVILSFAVLTS